MVSVQNISVSFGSFDLLSEVSFLINDQDRIGLTGKNGAGKSTLLKIIAGFQRPTSGQIDMSKDITIGYLPQQMKVDDKTTVLNETISAFSELINLSKEIENCSSEISRREDYDSPDYLNLCDRLTIVEERHRMLGGDHYMADTEQILLGLGFERSDFERPTKELSGGWRMRIELAKLLLKKPSLLLLDEPTNHLDIESIQWLESFLSGYSGAVVMVSHDKAMLDNVTKRTIEISLGKIYDYKASWSKYIELRKDRREQQLASFRNQQKMIDDTEKFIERFRYKATKAVQVQSKIKLLDKIERIEIDEEDNSSINFRFPPAPRSGTIVIEADKLSKSYGETKVLNSINIKIHRGEKVAFVGRNGEGKTTLSKIIIGELDHRGTFKTGHNVKIGYFAQNQDALLDNDLTVLQTIDNIAVGEIRTKIRNILGAFLFSGDDVEKKVKVLSGGERSRLAIVKLLLEPVNLLVLDEPTNHLDMKSKEILKQALIKFDGTLIVVSHDRDFLDGIVNKVFEFRDHNIKENIGGIYDFLRKRKIDNLKEIEKKESNNINNKNEVITSNKQKYFVKKELERNIRKLKKRIEESEAKIEKLEAEIMSIDKSLSELENSSSVVLTDFNKYQNLNELLKKEMDKWTHYNNEIEKILNQ